ncbi:DUF4123 domain-containing protein [Chromohalobacter israelensis]|uniref:DUF4123 domain-containing protein n=1 Tax=Chromohalobacter israelensis (strain ATCC BAA-138 / DSM 3043 / CIP 106854 / NCIMB 13768 / 1H11) TaxID=290398 RepID=Q1R139_CHRI1|nr:DUF4123 domain-containing protein [Chromohalobacter salexigens]ABE57569.1 hypothetical protein Csal_0205 [Chromohalobacter salexigens DSM 3043]
MSLSDEALKARISRYVLALEECERDSVSVCAIVETGLLSEEERNALWKRFSGQPWLQQPQFQVLQPLGPWLFGGDIETLLSELYPMAERGFHGLLITHQPVAQEAVKLGELCAVQDTNEEEQLLRYYAPHVFPVLHRFSDTSWYDRLFGSLSFWWLPGLEGWKEYAGTWHHQGDIIDTDDTIALTPALLQALGSDPLAHQILAELEALSPALFDVACSGIRLAIVDKAISRAREAGLSSTQDLSVYAAYCVAYGMEVTCEPEFARAVELSLSGSRSLAEHLKATGSQSISEAHHG